MNGSNIEYIALEFMVSTCKYITFNSDFGQISVWVLIKLTRNDENVTNSIGIIGGNLNIYEIRNSLLKKAQLWP